MAFCVKSGGATQLPPETNQRAKNNQTRTHQHNHEQRTTPPGEQRTENHTHQKADHSKTKQNHHRQKKHTNHTPTPTSNHTSNKQAHTPNTPRNQDNTPSTQKHQERTEPQHRSNSKSNKKYTATSKNTTQTHQEAWRNTRYNRTGGANVTHTTAEVAQHSGTQLQKRGEEYKQQQKAQTVCKNTAKTHENAKQKQSF